VIRRCTEDDFGTIFEIINDAASAYRGVIPADRWKDPYMPSEELRHQIAEGVEFWGYESAGELVGVMGIQPVQDVTLIRHAYVRTASRNKGLGGALLAFLVEQIQGPVLIGTWADAVWAVRFYEKHGFRRVSVEQKNRLLKKYWSIPARQVKTSVVLADRKWIDSGIRVYTKDDLPLKQDVDGAQMWAVALENTMFTYFDMEAYTEFPEHSHEAEQITLVLEGELSFKFADRTIVLKTGDVIAIPSHAAHSASTGGAPCKAVDAWSPIRKEYLKA
jgi:N-acetylglutamate synthase-like GNAT family acetyltransferase